MLEQKIKGRARVRIAVFFIISIHVIGLMALLMQGCRKPAEPTDQTADTNAVAPPAVDVSNLPPVEPNLPATNVAIPPLPPAGGPTATPTSGNCQDYVVAKGDSFYSIAKHFGVTMKAIQEANPGVEPTKLKVGQKLCIPVVSATSPAPVAPTATIDAAHGEVYAVKSGDTLTKIAAEHGTTIKALRAANPKLTSDRITVGQKLNLPARASTPGPVETAPTPPVAPPPAAPAPGAAPQR